MTKGPWKFERSGTHFHVVMSDDETLDVCSESDARIIAQVPEMVRILKRLSKINCITTDSHILQVNAKTLLKSLKIKV